MEHHTRPSMRRRTAKNKEFYSLLYGAESISSLLISPVGLLMARCAEGNQILGSVIAQSASRTNVMDLKILHAPAQLAAPAISLEDSSAELAIGFRIKPQAWPFCIDPSQSVTCTFSTSCSRCAFERPIASRVRQGNRASRLPASRLTPARKSAQIISKQ
jgi:hypothetical protein